MAAVRQGTRIKVCQGCSISFPGTKNIHYCPTCRGNATNATTKYGVNKGQAYLPPATCSKCGLFSIQAVCGLCRYKEETKAYSKRV